MDLQSVPPGTAGWPAPSAGPQGSQAWLPAPPSAAPGKRRWIRWVALGAAVLVVLGIVVIPRAMRAVNGPARAARVYLGLVRDGSTDAAYASLCSELRQQASPADFTAELGAEADEAGRLQSFTVSRSMVQIGGNTGMVDFRARTSKADLAMEARMVHEDGGWRWCGSRPQPKSVGVTVPFP